MLWFSHTLVVNNNFCCRAMAAMGCSFSKLQDITTCSICLETFKKPKVLPCIHTFCLQCLDTYSKNKAPGEVATCPLCRKVFIIPKGGVENLPNNFFINQLLQADMYFSSYSRWKVLQQSFMWIVFRNWKWNSSNKLLHRM